MFINLLNFNSIRSSVYKPIEFIVVSDLLFMNLLNLEFIRSGVYKSIKL